MGYSLGIYGVSSVNRPFGLLDSQEFLGCGCASHIIPSQWYAAATVIEKAAPYQ